MACEFAVDELWFVRRMSVQPDGAVIVAVFGRTPMAAIITSPLVVAVGLLIVNDKVPDPAAAEAAALKDTCACTSKRKAQDNRTNQTADILP